MNQFLTLWQNKHTSGAAMAFFALGVASIFFPQYKDKLDEVGKLAIFWGILKASDAKVIPSLAETKSTSSEKAL